MPLDTDRETENTNVNNTVIESNKLESTRTAELEPITIKKESYERLVLTKVIEDEDNYKMNPLSEIILTKL